MSVQMRRAQSALPHPDAPASEWLTTPEVAALLRVHPKHVYRLLHQGMPARRVGGQWRFSRNAIQQWAELRGGALASADEPPSAPLTPAFSLLAAEPNEISDAVVATLANAAGVNLAVVPASPQKCLDLLGSGDVAAALLRAGSGLKAACATVRIHLGARQLGLITRPGKSTNHTVAVPAHTTIADSVIRAAWPRAVLRHERTELDACASVARKQAAAALGSAAWAQRLGLSFRPIGSEAWELAVRVDAMEDPAVARMCVAAQGNALRDQVGPLVTDAPERTGQMRLESGEQPGPARHIASDDPEPAARAQSSLRWTILTRDRADQMLRLVDVLRARGLTVGGFIQVPAGPASSKPLGYDLYRLSRAERIPLAERIRHDQLRPTGERYCELSFHPDTLARACEWLREDVSTVDLLVVDGIGRLEEQGQGLFPALAWARMQPRPKLIVLSSKRSHVPNVAKRLSLPSRLVTELSLGAAPEPAANVVAHILRVCGSQRQPRRNAARAE